MHPRYGMEFPIWYIVFGVRCSMCDLCTMRCRTRNSIHLVMKWAICYRYVIRIVRLLLLYSTVTVFYGIRVWDAFFFFSFFVFYCRMLSFSWMSMYIRFDTRGPTKHRNGLARFFLIYLLIRYDNINTVASIVRLYLIMVNAILMLYMYIIQLLR